MSQENNSNIDEILEQIKKCPEDMGQDSRNGIPRRRNRLYMGIILALEDNDINKMSSSLLSASKLLAIDVEEHQNANIVRLDVDIIMKLTEKLLERANDIDINITECVERLFSILDVAMDKYRKRLGAKTTGQDIENCISLADKVFASSDNIKTDVFVLNNIFSILNNTIYYCNEEIKSGSVSKVIEFVETVEKDKRIQWDDVTVRPVLWALRSISERSESLSPDQADKIFNMTNAFVGKTDNLGTLNSTHVCEMLINPLRDMLCKKNNPAKIDVKQCLDLVKQILNKSDVVHHPNMGLGLIEAVIDIINYYGKDEENETDIQEYGFGVQNQEIRSFDSNKLKKFVSEKMFDVFEKYLRNKLGAIEVNDNVIDNQYRAKVNVNVPPDNQNLSEVQENTEEHKSNLNDHQNKNNDVSEHKYSSTANADMPTNNQNSSETSPNVFDNNSNIKKSMSFDEIFDTFVAHTNDLKEEVGEPRVFEDLSSENLPLPQHVRQPTEISDVNSTINNLNLINSNTEVKDEKPISDGKIINSDKLGINNDNQPVQTGNYNNIQINPEVSKNNKGNETQKDEAEYEPTKMFVILAVLSLFAPFLPGFIFVIEDNKKKESLLIKVLVFIPVVSPIILWIKTYKAYQANKVLEAKKALAKAEPSLELYSKTNNFQNIHDMQKRKSEINGEKDESEKKQQYKRYIRCKRK